MSVSSLLIDSYQKLREAFDQYDGQARKYKHRRFIPAWVAGLVLGFAAVYCFAIMLVFGIESEYNLLINVIEFVAVFGSFLLLTKAANQFYAKFLFHRRVAEILRHHMILADHGITIPNKQVEIITHGIKPNGHVRPDRERQLTITFIPLTELSTKPVMPHAVRHTLLDVLETQIAHHKNTRISTFKRRKKQLNVIIACVKYAFLAVILAKFIIELLIEVWHMEQLHAIGHVLNFYIILLPTLYAGLEGVKYFSDWQRNIDIAETKVTELSALRSELLLAADDALPAWTRRLQSNLDAENIDWLERNVSKKLEPLIYS